MRLKPEQMEHHLLHELAPVYLISGDEPQQLGEMADGIRSASKKAGFDAREIFSGDTGFEWSSLAVSAGSLSVFSDKKLIDLRLPSASPGSEGSKALIAYCERPPEDTRLLMTTGKLSADSLKSRWFQAIDKAGVVIQVWPLEGQELIRWLQNRMQRRGLQADSEGIKLLASRVEGNLLAAAQEIEKLFVLYGTGRIGSQQIMDAVSDNSRYDVFQLIDSVLAPDISKILKIVHVLRAEGTAAPIVLWALTREARTIMKVKQALALGQQRDIAFRNHQIWEKRRLLVDNALKRLEVNDLYRILEVSAKADRQIKGQDLGDPWETVLKVSLMFAQARVLAEPK